MAQGLVPCAVVIHAVVADPGIIYPGLFCLCHGCGQLSALPQLVMDRNGSFHGGRPVLFQPAAASAGGKGHPQTAVRHNRTGNGVITLLAVAFHHSQRLLHLLAGADHGNIRVGQRQRMVAGGEHIPHTLVHFRLRLRRGNIRPRLHQTGQCGPHRAVGQRHIPLQGQPQLRVQQPRQHGCRRAPGNGLVGVKASRLIAALADSPAVEQQNILIIRCTPSHR